MLGWLVDSNVKTLSDGEMMDRERKGESDYSLHLGGWEFFYGCSHSSFIALPFLCQFKSSCVNMWFDVFHVSFCFHSKYFSLISLSMCCGCFLSFILWSQVPLQALCGEPEDLISVHHKEKCRGFQDANFIYSRIAAGKHPF